MAFLVLLVLALIPANVASKKGKNFGLWLFYGFFLFPFALVHSLLLEPTADAPDKKKCPQCKGIIDVEARKCPKCGSDLKK